MTTTWLDCPVCGADLFESDEDGLFFTYTMAVCLECAVISWIDVDYSDCDEDDGDSCGTATVSTHEHTADVGQPLCTGACGLEYLTPEAKAEFLGMPCQLDGWGTCPLAKDFGPVVELEVQVGEEPAR